MSETYGNTGLQDDDATRGLGSVEPTTGASGTGTSGVAGMSSSSDTKEVAKEEARATGAQAKEGARHVAEVSKDEAKNVAQETTQQAKQLWNQTRSQLMDQSAQQQTRVADGLRSLSQELSTMARSSDQQGVASDLAQQASQRMGDVAGWLEQRDPGSLVSELKQFARQRPGAFLAGAAVLGLIGGRLSRGMVADHQDQSDSSNLYGYQGGSPTPVDHSTGGYSAYGSTGGTATPAGDYPVSDSFGGAGDVQGTTGTTGAGTTGYGSGTGYGTETGQGTGTGYGTGTGTGTGTEEFPR